MRVFATGNGRKTDPVDAHSVALAALYAPADPGLVRVVVDDDPGLGEDVPVGARQARALIARTKPRDLVGKTHRRLSVELVGELESIDKEMKAADKDLTALVHEGGSTLLELNGIGPSGAARLLVDVGDIHRFRDKDRFAMWNGTAPLDASSGNQQRHPLSGPGTGGPAAAIGRS